MNLIAPPRPEPELRPGDHVDADTGEALVEALIKEARRRARRRRCGYAGAAALLSLLVVLAATELGGPAESRNVSAASASSGVAAGGPSRLAFLRSLGVGGPTSVLVMNADGTGRRVLSRDAEQAGLAWSPDGRKIAFVGSPPGLAAELYLMNVDGSGLRRLTHGHRFAEVAFPSWSSDGRMIAFIRKEGVHALDSLYVINVDGSGERRVTRAVVRPSRAAYRAFSPDAKQIAFAKWVDPETSGSAEAFVVNADGSGLRNVTRAWGVDGIPVWSPDGRRIAFVSWPDGMRQLSVMNADGTGRQTLSRAAFGIPVWSPDGREIAFEAVRPPQGSVVPEIHVVNADGTRERTLTTRGADPVWSPDGRTIAFVNTVVERAGSRIQGPPFDLEIYVVNADGSGQRRLTHSVSTDGWAAWSPVERQT